MPRERLFPVIRIPESEWQEAKRRREEYFAHGEEWSMWECIRQIEQEKSRGKTDPFGRLRL